MIDELLRSRKKMALNCGCVFGDEVIVKPLVISEIKTELLQARLQTPIDLCQK